MLNACAPSSLISNNGINGLMFCTLCINHSVVDFSLLKILFVYLFLAFAFNNETNGLMSLYINALCI